VRAGSSLSAALLDEAAACVPLRPALARLADGKLLVEALDAIDATDADLALTVQALSASAQLGGPIAATLDAAAAVLRERAAARAERRAHSAQARISARVLTAVPLAFAMWNSLTSRTTRLLYASNQAVAVCAAGGLLLNAAGWWWMRKIVGPP
jgi:tight adherence protein B